MKKSIFAPWLVRFYEWYFHSKRGRSPQQENFCHFGRVVFFWAPLFWFFRRRLVFGIRPWMPVTLAVWASLTAISPSLMLAATGVVAVACIWAVLLFAIPPAWCDEIGRFLGIRVTQHVQLWMIVAVALFAGLSYFFPEIVLTTLLLLAFIVAVVVAVVVVVWVLYWILYVPSRAVGNALAGVEWPKISVPVRVSEGISRPVRSFFANLGGVLSIAWHFLVVLKRRTICPWVSFADGHIEFVFAPEPPRSPRSYGMEN